jgi:hypothetical protein
VSSGPHRRSKAGTCSTATRHKSATQQVLGEETLRRSPRHRTTCLSRPRRTSRRRTHAGRHPRRPVPIPQRHAPHPSELQRLQALRRTRPTLPTSTSSSTAGRTRRTATTPAAGGGRMWSLPACRRRGQCHLRQTQITGEQETTKAQRSPDTGGNYRPSRPIPMVGAPDHLHSGGSMAQLRPPRQIPAPRRSGDPRKQGEEGTGGRGSSINVTFLRTLQGLGVHLKELHESDNPFFGIVPSEGEYPLGHIYMPVTFGTPKNYITEFLRFEVANFDCRYNAVTPQVLPWPWHLYALMTVITCGRNLRRRA